MPTIRERNGRFQAQVRVKRDGVIVHQENDTFDTRKQAETWSKALEKRLKNEGYVSRKQGAVTFDILMDKHEAMLTALGKPTVGLCGRFKNLRTSKFASKPVDKITSADLVQWCSEFSRTRSPATVLNHLMAVSTCFRAAKVVHGVDADVSIVAGAISHLKRLGVAATSENRDRRVTEEEVYLICKYRNEQPLTAIPLESIIRLSIALPRRRGEILTMKWSDYDAERGELKLWDTKNPTKVRNETIPVPPEAQRILATLPRIDARILPYNKASVSGALHKAAIGAGMKNLRLHDLRHEGVSRLFEAGLNIPEVSSISGHLSWVTLKRYTHIKPSTVLEKLNAGVKKT
jgi:integrase